MLKISPCFPVSRLEREKAGVTFFCRRIISLSETKARPPRSMAPANPIPSRAGNFWAALPEMLPPNLDLVFLRKLLFFAAITGMLAAGWAILKLLK
jgi:hypothetical protein